MSPVNRSRGWGRQHLSAVLGSESVCGSLSHGRGCREPGWRQDLCIFCLWLSGPVLLHSVSCRSLNAASWVPCPGPRCLSVLHPSSGMLPSRVKSHFALLGMGAWWKGARMAVGWRKWMPAVRKASRKHLTDKPWPQRTGEECGQAVKAFSVSVGRAVPGPSAVIPGKAEARRSSSLAPALAAKGLGDAAAGRCTAPQNESYSPDPLLQGPPVPD